MSQSNVEFEISLDIAVTTSLRDDMTKGEKKDQVYISTSCSGFGATVICFYSESELTCFLYSVSLSLKLTDAGKLKTW